MSQSWFVAVTAGRWQNKTITVAKSLGYKIIAIDADEHAEGFVNADVAIISSLDNTQYIIEKIKHLNIKGVLSICSDAGMLLAGTIRDYFGINTGPNYHTSQMLVNKRSQREVWLKDEVQGPQWQVSSQLEELIIITKKMSLPFIIKPVDNAGSRGVYKVESFNQPIKEYLQSALSFSKTGDVLIESYMDGIEYTIETFVHRKVVNVLAITEKKKIAAANGLVAYQLMTTALEEADKLHISSLVCRAFESIGYENGPGHAEVIMMKDGSVGMVELAGRGGGFLVFEQFVELSSGYDIVKNSIRQSMGDSIDTIQTKENHTLLYFFPNKKGRVTAISGFEQANNIQGIIADSFIDVGVELDEACCDGDRMGYFISNASTLEQSQLQAKQAKTYINYEVY